MDMPATGGVTEAPRWTDETGTVIADCACKRCHYNVRGLREDGRCPECGTPVGLSLRGELLRYSDPEWVEMVAKGLTIILWMILGALVAGIIGAFAGQPVAQGAQLLVGLIAFYGVWLMTEPDPSGIGEDRELTARRVVRITLIIGLASQVLAIGGGAGTATVSRLLLALGGIGSLVAVIGEFAKFIYYEKLARRIPNEGLAERARFLKWAFTITLGTMLLLALIAMVPGVAMMALLMLPASLALIVFSVMTLFLLLRLRREIVEQARHARESWAADA